MFTKKDLLERFDNDLELILQVTQIFKTSSHDNLEKIEQAITEKDHEKMRINSHSLKGAASNFSPTIVTEKARQIEEKAKNKDFENTQQLLLELRQEVEELQQHLEKMS